MSDEPENSKFYDMWYEESDPEDVEYNGKDEESDVETDAESDKRSDEFSDAESKGTGNEDKEDSSSSEGYVEKEERKSLKRKKKGKKQKNVCPEESSSDGSLEKEERKSLKRKKKGKKQKNECQEDSIGEERMTDERKKEEEMERFEYEVDDSVSGFVDEIRIGRNTIPDSSDSEKDPIVLRDRRVRRRRDDRLAIGSTFLTGVEFKEAVLDYALSTGQNVIQERWEKKKLGFSCGMGKTCKWRVYCAYDKPRQMYLVKTTYAWHSCTPNGKCKILKSPVIARLFMDKLRLNPKFMPADIQQYIKERWKLVASIPQCQRGRLLGLQSLDEEYAQQFAYLRGYITEILTSNPGSSVFIDTYPNADGEDVFNRFYVCFDILRTSWRGTCRPILGLDGTFLKVAVKGVLLTDVGHDANNQIYPVAWAVVQSENADNWQWSVNQLKGDLDLEDGHRHVIISDRSKGLISAVKTELPNAEHRKCVKHIIENLKKDHGKKDQLKPLVWKLAWSYNASEYAENLDNLRRYNLDLYNDVMKEEPETWSRAFYRIGSCCEDVDNNATESFNSTITKARAKSLVPMLETIRRQGMKRITKRNKKSRKHESTYSEYVVKTLELEKENAEKCTTYRGTHGMFEVHLFGNAYKVDIQKMTCSCCKWQISGIPCEHAYGAMIDAGLNTDDYVSGFVSVFFLTDMWRDLYETATIPLRGPKFWMNSSYKLVVAPPEPILPGRKKTTKKKSYPRIKGKHESPKKKKKQKETLGREGRIMHCSKCGEAGHNAAGCKKFPKEKVKRTRKAKTTCLDEAPFPNKKVKKGDNKAEKATKHDKKLEKPKKAKKSKKTNTDGLYELGASSSLAQDTITLTQPTQATQPSDDVF